MLLRVWGGPGGGAILDRSPLGRKLRIPQCSSRIQRPSMSQQLGLRPTAAPPCATVVHGRARGRSLSSSTPTACSSARSRSSSTRAPPSPRRAAAARPAPRPPRRRGKGTRAGRRVGAPPSLSCEHSSAPRTPPLPLSKADGGMGGWGSGYSRRRASSARRFLFNLLWAFPRAVVHLLLRAGRGENAQGLKLGALRGVGHGPWRGAGGGWGGRGVIDEVRGGAEGVSHVEHEGHPALARPGRRARRVHYTPHAQPPQPRQQPPRPAPPQRRRRRRRRRRQRVGPSQGGGKARPARTAGPTESNRPIWIALCTSRRSTEIQIHREIPIHSDILSTLRQTRPRALRRAARV